MGTDVAHHKAAGGLSFKLPDYLAARVKDVPSNIPDKPTTNSLSFPGRGIWQMTVNGETKILQRKIAVLDDDGNPTGEFDVENSQTVNVIVLDWNTHQERSYHERGFDGVARPPDCWSPDGRKPHPSVEEPQSVTCELCPKSAKGSRVVDGKEVVACGKYRNLAVIPAKSPDFPALRLRLSQTSDFDSRDEEATSQGWLSWSHMKDYLKSNGLPHTVFAILKVRFANNVTYPKLQFKHEGFVPEDQIDALLARSKSDEVRKILAGFTPSDAPKGKPLPKDEPPVDGPAPDPVFSQTGCNAEAEAKAAAKAKREAKAAEKARAEAEAKAAADAAAAKAAKIAEAKRLLAEAEGTGDAFDEALPTAPAAALEGDVLPPTKPRVVATATATPSATAPVEVPAALASVLGDW
jgi:hypothetical protein